MHPKHSSTRKLTFSFLTYKKIHFLVEGYVCILEKLKQLKLSELKLPKSCLSSSEPLSGC